MHPLLHFREALSRAVSERYPLNYRQGGKGVHRANPLFPTDYNFREVYLLATAADEEANAVGGARKGMEGWVACFPKAQLKDVLFCGGVTGAGEIEGNEALARARLMGNS